jgi:hypothetical protein
MKHCSILVVPPIGLLLLACAWPAHAGASEGLSATRPQPARSERGTPDRATQSKGSNGATNANANASSRAVASSEGGVGVGSQGQSMTVDSHARAAASTAIAPALTGSNDTCMGSTSIGAAGLAFGVSFGSTYTDDNCTMLKNSRELWNMGYRGAAIARMCMDDRNRHALEATGVACPAPPAAKERAGATEQPADPIYPNVGSNVDTDTQAIAMAKGGAGSKPTGNAVERRAEPGGVTNPDRRASTLRNAVSSSAQPDRFVR